MSAGFRAQPNSTLRFVRIAAALGVIVLSVVALAPIYAETAHADPTPPSRPPPTLADYDVHTLRLGGDFTLTNQDSKPTSLKAYRGRVVVVFFGYTYCPDVCPVTMVKMGRVRMLLGKRGPSLETIFVSIDPARDTPQRLKAYLANFDTGPGGRGTIALTGSDAQVKKATDLFRVRYEKEEPTGKDQYLMAHTAYLYMLDGRGRLRYVFPPDVPDQMLADGIHKLLEG
jgi:protein SCO1